MPWSQMILLKEDKLGAKDLSIVIRASNVKRISKFWDLNDSILIQWMQKRYIKGRALDDIPSKPTIDSISGNTSWLQGRI